MLKKSIEFFFNNPLGERLDNFLMKVPLKDGVKRNSRENEY